MWQLLLSAINIWVQAATCTIKILFERNAGVVDVSIVDEIIHSENVYSGRPADSFHSLSILVIVKECCLRLDSVTGWVWNRFVEYNFIILLHEQTLEKTDGSIKNG